MNLRSFLTLFTIITFISCSKEKFEDPMIDYYITINDLGGYDQVTIDFEYARAIQHYPDPSNLSSTSEAVRSIYLNSKQLTFSKEGIKTVYLGQSQIEPYEIDHFDVNLSNFRALKDSGLLSLPRKFINSVETGELVRPNLNENLSVIFEIQLKESMLEENGMLYFEPVIKSVVELN